MELINASHGHKNRAFNIQSISYIFRILAEGPYNHILAKVYYTRMLGKLR